MSNIPAGMSRSQFELAVHQLSPQHEYRLLNDTEYEWRSLVPEPTTQELTDALAIVEQEQAAEDSAETTAQTERNQLLAQATGTIAQLQLIIDDTALTNTERDAAIKLLAQIQQRLIRILIRAINKGRL